MRWWLSIILLLSSVSIAIDQTGVVKAGSPAIDGDCEDCRFNAGRLESQHRTQNADGRGPSLPAEIHWYEPPNPLGLEVFTREKLSWMAADAIGLRYTGPLRRPLADQLRELLLATPPRYNHVILELDSDGGELAYVKELVKVLEKVRAESELTTRVMEGSICASGCIPLFMQGVRRKASGASIWVFHGASSAFTNIPDVSSTDDYLDLLTSAGMTSEFRATLQVENHIYRPGSLILSGYELFAVQKAGIITDIYPAWRAEEPIFPSGLGPR